MNWFQVIYALWLAALIWRGWSGVTAVLAANMAATLAACLAMDLGHIDRDGATIWQAVIDAASGAALAFSKETHGKVIAVGYAVSVLIYSLSLIFGVTEGATFAIVNALAVLQLGVASIGSGSGGGLRGGGRHRYSDLRGAVAVSGRNHGMVSAGDARSFSDGRG